MSVHRKNAKCVIELAGKDNNAKAQKALKATKKGTWRKQRKTRTSVTFHRPKTLRHPREPKYPRSRYVLLSLSSS